MHLSIKFLAFFALSILSHSIFAAVDYTLYLDREEWINDAGGSVLIEDFEDRTFIPELTISNTNGYRNDFRNDWYDRLTRNGPKTVFTFSEPTNAFGGDWTMDTRYGGQGENGIGIAVSLDLVSGERIRIFREIPNDWIGFWGVILSEDVKFTSVRLDRGTQAPDHASEIYYLDNLSFTRSSQECDVVDVVDTSIQPLSPTDSDTADLSGWVDTGANNALSGDDELFQLENINGEQVFATHSSLTNIHSHFSTSNIQQWTSYEFTGQMMMDNAGSGLGITFSSQYPQADVYYRLRRYGSQPSFRLSPHGTHIAGNDDSGVIPLANQWYQFRVRVEDAGTQTTIQARIWADGEVEPQEWQINAYDDSSSRLSSGTIGVWAMAAGGKYWRDFSVANLAEPAVPVNVPDILGMSNDEAESALFAAGLQLGTVTEAYSDQHSEGKVFEQAPVACTSVVEGSAVDLTVSLGAAVYVDSPNVVDLLLRDAETQILESGLELGELSYVYSDTVPDTQVISQTPSAGEAVLSGSSINLEVSKGPRFADYELHQFETATPGEPPEGWLSTGAQNSLTEDRSRFEVTRTEGGGHVIRAGHAPGNNTNIHLHYTGEFAERSGYQTTGFIMISDANGGAGVTFFSQFPEADKYYRLRRWYGGRSFHVSAHGTSVKGDINSGIEPLVNRWYQYRISVEDTGERTEIRARLWLQWETEPTEWQINAYDDSETRLKKGAIGVWSMPHGVSYWDDFGIWPLP